MKKQTRFERHRVEIINGFPRYKSGTEWLFYHRYEPSEAEMSHVTGWGDLFVAPCHNHQVIQKEQKIMAQKLTPFNILAHEKQFSFSLSPYRQKKGEGEKDEIEQLCSSWEKWLARMVKSDFNWDSVVKKSFWADFWDLMQLGSYFGEQGASHGKMESHDVYNWCFSNYWLRAKVCDVIVRRKNIGFSCNINNCIQAAVVLWFRENRLDEYYLRWAHLSCPVLSYKAKKLIDAQ